MSHLIPAPGLTEEDELAFRSMIVCPPAFKVMHLRYTTGDMEDSISDDNCSSGSGITDEGDSSVDSSSEGSSDDNTSSDNSDDDVVRGGRGKGKRKVKKSGKRPRNQ